MRGCASVLLGAIALSCAGPALAAEPFTKTVKGAHGKLKIMITPADAETQAPSIAHPRLGIAPSANVVFSASVARAFDDTGRVTVVPPARLPDASQLSAGFEQLVRSEFADAVATACRSAHLDYLLVMGTPTSGARSDVTSFIIFVGKTHYRTTQESRLYDCRSRKSVWVASTLFETSYATFTSAFNGNLARGMFGDPEASRAFATLYADKLSADMRW